MRKVGFMFFVLLLFNCNSKTCFEERSINELKNIFSKDTLNNEYYNSLKEYKLTKEDIDLIDELIKKAFIEFNSNLNRGGYRLKKLPSFKEYGYILSPYIDKLGDKRVQINASWNDDECPELGSLEEWYGVMDGGNSLIRLNINLSTKTVSYIMPNGEA
ncbi:hypothetical protein HER15_10145 [Tenacibaculum mesophilum]|uniref:Uncharacterized protein n=1 Tax=Tenacibaculum mesophilum TaxID=104268 RepID=A0AAE9SGR5_9FLAO|nr:hypothetical protein [Tenacibaculum mesophilum]UTD15808.1 hypothetical protein HER15_10145 [Tenacibaculum mesophilum]